MLKKFLFIIFAFLLMQDIISYANPTDTLSGNITTTLTLQNTKRYLIRTTVLVKQGGALVIPAGTIIYGEKQQNNVVGSLVIERGGIIYANGTASQPIIFTSVKPPNVPPPTGRGAGDWGGVIILGRARINTASGLDTAQIEGLAGIYYGGQNDVDSSGLMRYCRIEYSGVALSANNEINGLTMGGVGSKTVIEYIQVSWNGDDSFEWFGGTVNARYLVSYFPVDDELDNDFGYRGKIQFALCVRHPVVADVSGSTCIESDNNSGPNYNIPRTQPHISNVTSIGPKQYDTSVVSPLFTRNSHIRRNSLASVYNSVMMGWPQAVLYDGTGVQCAIQNDTSRVKANIFAGCYNGSGATTPAGCSFDHLAYTTGNNTILSTTAAAMLSNPYSNVLTGSYSLSNFYPLAGSPALSGANFTYPGINDPWFIVTTYRGAFDQNSTWANGWTNFRPDTVDYKAPIGIQPISTEVPKSFGLSQNYPNPFNPTTNINFNISTSGIVNIKLFDVLGREVANIVNNENVKPGIYRVDFNASTLSSGVYFYKMTVTTSDNVWVDTKKMMLVK